MLDFILWYLLTAFIGLLALPVVYRLFPFLGDRGYTFARTMGLLLWGFIFWLLASLHVIQNDTGGVLVALALLAGLGFLSNRQPGGWQALWAWLKSRKRLIFTAEGLFLVAFIFMAMMRAANPEITGTEKPMELAFINSILRSPSFPPADPWLSGYSISYYYFGYVIVAMLIRLTGVLSGVGFNLALSLVFSLTAIGAYGVVYSLLAAWSHHRQSQGKSGIYSQGWALLAPLFILILSNLEGGFEALHAKDLFWQQSGLTQKSQFWSWLGLQELNQPPSEPYTWIPNRSGGIWWWRASRVLQDYNMETEVLQAIPGVPFSSYIATVPNKSGPIEVIDEFPFFSYFLADLHPHVLSMAFVMLAIGLALNLYLRGAQESIPGLNVWEWVRKEDFWLSAVILGGLSFLNTWDFPIYLALFSATYTLVRFQQSGWKWIARLKDLIFMMAILGIAGVGLYLPFYVGFASQAGGILPSLVFFTRGVHFWIMFGVLLTPLVFWLFWLARRQGSKHHFGVGLRFALVILGILWVGSYLIGIVGLNLATIGSMASGGSAAPTGLVASLTTWGNLFMGLQGSGSSGMVFWGSLVRRIEMPGTWLTLTLLLAGVWALLASFRPQTVEQADPAADESDSDPQMDSELPVEPEIEVPEQVIQEERGNPNGFVLLLVLVGIGLALVPEFVYLRDQFGWRMNTIFKFYYQTWMVWGLAAVFATVLLWKEAKGFLAISGRTISVFICLVGLAYPFFGISERFNEPVSKWTLNGNAYLDIYDPDDKAAMDWLAQAPYGAIVEAVGGSYSSAARMATQSGLPNVLGWPGHEGQWRGGGAEMGSRQDDISQMYRSRDWNEIQAILERYQIRYVVIGQLERNTYTPNDQAAQRGLNEQIFQAHLKVVFQKGGTTIYEVNQVTLAAGKENR